MVIYGTEAFVQERSRTAKSAGSCQIQVNVTESKGIGKHTRKVLSSIEISLWQQIKEL